ncbi:WAT1-related protein At2g39510-like isoform X1 [Castanea sativa]|uniref:WAT1-related protein At2g39510-like isoform X1 n=1 Tax=Castanea sativa TaxID=21020 RepID=UPI003F65230D
MSMESRTQLYKKVKPFVAIILVQLGHAGMSIIGKLALNKGMNPRVFIAYRYAVATVIIAPFAIVYDRKKRAKLTYSIFAKIMLLALLGPVAYQNLYYEGMKLTTATYSRALFNVVPAFTFAMAWILRLEKVNIRRRGSQAKVLGTIVTIGGAMLMTLVKGPSWIWPWTYKHGYQESTSAGNKQDVIKGALMMLAGFFCWSGYVNLQGIVTTAFSIYIHGMVIKEKGPVFMTAFNPLSMILVAIIGSFVLVEAMFLGSVIGAIVIIVGLCMFLWGKSQDQPLNSGAEKVVTTAQNMATADERMMTSNQEFMAINVTSAKSTDGTA